jgi:hypothetical protein
MLIPNRDVLVWILAGQRFMPSTQIVCQMRLSVSPDMTLFSVVYGRKYLAAICCLLLQPWKWRQHDLPKRCSVSTRLHDVTSYGPQTQWRAFWHTSLSVAVLYNVTLWSTSREIGKVGASTKVKVYCVNLKLRSCPGPQQCSLAWVFVNKFVCSG